MYKALFNRLKSKMPKISSTELVAIKTGGCAIDRDIMMGNYHTKFAHLTRHSISEGEHQFINTTCTDLLDKYRDTKPFPDKARSLEMMRHLGQEGFLSLIIDPKYGGRQMSVTAQSKILTKISSKNPALGVLVMVPNSLGPGELLQHFGTEQQKHDYLPRLSNGQLIPCFGLTGPNNGSDAIGQIDTGVIVQRDNRLYIKATVEKRYITLAPISNLVGLALKVEDPDQLLDTGSPGVTVVLLETPFEGLEQATYHNPSNAGFPNGTLKGQVEIPLENVIGGPENIGRGWEMLMTCLTVGRAVSLPASANAASKVAAYGIGKYIRHRTQFNRNIGSMQAIREKYNRLFINSWIVNASVTFTNTLLDSGHKSAVISSIMKYQATERGRIAVIEALDISAGSGICLGPNNFLHRFYEAGPIGITVEGSNTMTRSLMTFGQGLNKSHSHIFSIFESFGNSDHRVFRRELNGFLRHFAASYAASHIPYGDKLRLLVVRYANLVNFVALLGGKIKSEQMICGNMADILSNIYLSHALIWYHKNVFKDDNILKFGLDYLINDSIERYNEVRQNYPSRVVRAVIPKIRTSTYRDYQTDNKFSKYILDNSDVFRHIEQDIYLDEALASLKMLDTLPRDSPEYHQLYQKVISVGEFPVK